MRLHQLKAKRISHRQADVQMMCETESESMIHRTIEESEDTTQVHQLSMKKIRTVLNPKSMGVHNENCFSCQHTFLLPKLTDIK